MTDFQWDWEFTFRILPRLLDGFVITVTATAFGMLLAVFGGMILAMLRRSQVKWISWPAVSLIEFVRSTPLLVQLYFFFYVLPDFGVTVPDLGGTFDSALVTGILALGLHYSSYTSEVYRAGIDSIPKGQWEAAVALNFSRGHTWTKIIIPQAVPPVVPALGNYLIAMFKETPLLYAITVYELLGTAYQIGSEEFAYIEPITIVGALFLTVSLLSAYLVRLTERWLKLPGR